MLALLELALRVAHDHSPGLRRRLYMAGVRNEWDEAQDLRQLMVMTPHGLTPRRKHRDFILNSRGLKTSEYADEKARGTYRVVVLGDSFTFASGGVPYDDLWHVQLERLLEERRGAPVEVLSLGVRSVGPDFYRRMWELEGSRLGADLVVVGFFVGNDFADVKPPVEDLGGVDRLALRSYVVRLARNWVRDRGAAAAAAESPETEAREAHLAGGLRVPDATLRYDPDEPSLSEKAFLGTHAIRFRIFSDPHRLDECLARVEPHLLALRDGTAAAGADLVVMLIPSETQVEPELEALVARHLGLAPGSCDMERPNRALAERCDAAGIVTLDLLPAFREAARAGKLYRARDTHWNVEGNALAARELAALLERRALVD